MKLIYRTQQYDGYGKHNYYWNEYRQDRNEIIKFKCNKQKFFDGRENNWEESEKKVQSWNIDDPNIPEWLKNYI
ncbi:hypothetical protein [Streptococcus parauberis]|uniref:hypothetical protein n=1 Tax=Streptococcus parauberis TaxID=1348 RepID=UPI000789B392|nr:hypothetical protein [Streptococcus parauberis]KYP19810.1 hypothetical protein TN39_01115 [Streptococcus parauberis]KYP19906.1 hypothetical protein AKL14_00710 [Streptococcus parauberis]KYP22775.1 hypothetical protein AKL13_00098 [Streptococcus parauberis]KYP24067.1 hypothetical protein TP84_01798 [Streptococcus parauberis]KYP25285.1 hypothetical protein TM50_01502 [Streptococcus parauberis]